MNIYKAVLSFLVCLGLHPHAAAERHDCLKTNVFAFAIRSAMNHYKIIFSICAVLLMQPKSVAAASAEKPKTLSLEYVKQAAAKAESFAKKKGWKISIAIVNSEGNLMYFQRDVDAYSGSIEAAIQKARSSNAFQRPTSAFVESVKQGRVGIIGVKDIVALEGGVPILLDGKHVGAIGVSGARSTEDEEAAKAALE